MMHRPPEFTAQIVTTVRRTTLGTMLPSGLDDGTTDAPAYFRCAAILAVRLRPLKTPPSASLVWPRLARLPLPRNYP